MRDIAITGTRETIDRLPWNGIGEWLDGTWHWMSRAHYDDPSAIIVPVLMAVFLTLLRLFLTWTVFNVSGAWLCDVKCGLEGDCVLLSLHVANRKVVQTDS